MTGERWQAVYAIALGPDAEPLRRAKAPEAHLFDFACGLAIIARGQGWSDEAIAADPRGAVEAARAAWAKVEAVLEQPELDA